MILVLDGFNIIHKFPELADFMNAGDLVRAMNGLTSYMAELRNIRPGFEIHIFYDGRRRRGDDTFRDFVSGIHLYYSLEETADDLIEEYIESRMGNHQIKVVTSDKKVRHVARVHHCDVQSSEDFYRWYQSETTKKQKQVAEKPDKKLTDKEVQDWLKIFRNR